MTGGTPGKHPNVIIMTCTVTSLQERQRSFLCELHGSSSLFQWCFTLCEWPTLENWRTATAALMQSLCVRGAILSLRRYYHFLFRTTRWCKLFMSTNLCRWLRRLRWHVVPALRAASSWGCTASAWTHNFSLLFQSNSCISWSTATATPSGSIRLCPSHPLPSIHQVT